MAVPAHAAKDVTAPARTAGGRDRARRPDLRRGSTARAGTYPFEAGEQVVTGWHVHGQHQLEYAFQGVVEVETDTARYLLPPQQAIWIPAGVEHCTTLTRVRTVSVFFDPAGIPGPGPAGPAGLAGDRVRVLAAAPVIREMILYGRRWPVDREPGDPLAEVFFTALAGLVAAWLEHETPLCLPTSADPLLAAAMRVTDDRLAGVSMNEVCAAVGTSQRSLRRAFLAATGLTWRQYLLEARLLRAMALLSEPGPTVLAVATAVGFDSLSGFTRAFRRYTGETPFAYRRRVTGPPDGPGFASRRLVSGR